MLKTPVCAVHGSSITALSMAADLVVVSGGQDGSAWAWDWASGKGRHTIPGQRVCIYAREEGCTRYTYVRGADISGTGMNI